MIHASAIETTTDSATVPSDAVTLLRQPFTIPAAAPMIGVIKGATRIAPMITAVESERIANEAIVTDSSSITTYEVILWVRSGAS